MQLKKKIRTDFTVAQNIEILIYRNTSSSELYYKTLLLLPPPQPTGQKIPSRNTQLKKELRTNQHWTALI